MPEISRFLGIVIQMYREKDAPHHRAHFRAIYAGESAVFGLEPVEFLSGQIPNRQRRFVEVWTELHETELLLDWKLLQEGERTNPIEPLR